MKFIKKNWPKLVLLSYLIFVPVFGLYAQGERVPPSDPYAGKIRDPLEGRFGSIPALIKGILEGVIKIGIPIIALAIVYCGFLFVFARGNSEKLTKAKDALLYTLIGAAILLGSLALATMIDVTIKALG